MAFVIYPDRATAGLLDQPELAPLWLAAGEAMSRFVPLAPLIGPDLSADDQPTSFLRIALSGEAVNPGAPPRIELLARLPDGTPSGPAVLVDPNVAVSSNTMIALTDGNGTKVAAACFEPPYADNVYPLKVAILRPGTELSIRITNTTGIDRDFVWVVADNGSDTQQPWVHATLRDTIPIEISFEVFIGQTQSSDRISITNRGTGPTRITGVAPALAAGCSLFGLPATLAPNPPHPVLVQLSFQAPATPTEFSARRIDFIAANKLDPGPFGPGHNNGFTLRARALPLPEPILAASPNQFDPKEGAHQRGVHIFGRNLNWRPVSVHIADHEVHVSEILPDRLRFSIPPRVPAGPARFTVKTAGGRVVSDDTFNVWPSPAFANPGEQFSINGGGPGTEIRLFGRNFILPGAPSVRVSFDQSNPIDLPVISPPTDTHIDVILPNVSSEEVHFIIVWRSDGDSIQSDDQFFIRLI